ncbi:MAG: SCO family protein [Rhodothalassiaceae bacterium]
MKQSTRLAIPALALIALVSFTVYLAIRGTDRDAGVDRAGLAAGIAADVDLDAPVGGSFMLVGTDGRPVSDSDFRGQYMLMVFGYTYCPDVCPMSLLAVSNALSTLEQSSPERANRLTPVFVTLDPERDSPAVLRRYLKSFHPRTVGLTGSLADIQRMATAYAVRFSKVVDEDYSDYLLDHTTNIMLFDDKGVYLTHFSPQTPPELMADAIARYIR